MEGEGGRINSIRSRLYDCNVFHSRKEPIQHQFTYRYFTFCLDLDEVHQLSERSFLFGLQKLKPFRFVASDSLLGLNCNTAGELKESVIRFAERMGVFSPVTRVELLAHVRTLGYSYNPAAFYFGYDGDNRLLFALVEVTNTFHEKKYILFQYLPLVEVKLMARRRSFFMSRHSWNWTHISNLDSCVLMKNFISKLILKSRVRRPFSTPFLRGEAAHLQNPTFSFTY